MTAPVAPPPDPAVHHDVAAPAAELDLLETGMLQDLCLTLQARGTAVQVLLEQVGVTPQMLDGGSTPMPRRRWLEVAHALRAASACPQFGLLAGRRAPLVERGVLGPLLAASRTLRDALAALQQWQDPYGAVSGRIEPAAGGLRWVLETPRPLGDLRCLALDHAVAALASFVVSRSGGWREATRLEVPWSAPPWQQAYEALGVEVSFAAPRCAFWLSDTLLDVPAADWQEARWRAALSQVTAQAQERHAMGDRLADWIAAWLRQVDPREARLAVAARCFGISSRTLIRRLGREGTSFQALLDTHRQRETLRGLARPDLPVADLALQLGYLDASNFSRCVRRWFGQTPLALRARLLDGAEPVRAKAIEGGSERRVRV